MIDYTTQSRNGYNGLNPIFRRCPHIDDEFIEYEREEDADEYEVYE